jgi:hypothetical protein
MLGSYIHTGAQDDIIEPGARGGRWDGEGVYGVSGENLL